MPQTADWLEHQSLVFSCRLNDYLTSFGDILWNVQFLVESLYRRRAIEAHEI